MLLLTITSGFSSMVGVPIVRGSGHPTGISAWLYVKATRVIEGVYVTVLNSVPQPVVTEDPHLKLDVPKIMVQKQIRRICYGAE